MHTACTQSDKYTPTHHMCWSHAHAVARCCSVGCQSARKMQQCTEYAVVRACTRHTQHRAFKCTIERCAIHVRAASVWLRVHRASLLLATRTPPRHSKHPPLSSRPPQGCSCDYTDALWLLASHWLRTCTRRQSSFVGTKRCHVVWRVTRTIQ